MKIQHYISLITAFVLPLIASCSSGKTSHEATEEPGIPVPLSYARNLTINRFRDYVRADIRNPWDTTKTLHTYLLVPDSIEMPDNLPDGTVVRTPLKKSLIYSSVHNSLISELGAIGAIAGVCDPKYIHQKDLYLRIASGQVADCGNSMNPNIEKIIRVSPDGILLSPFENSGNYGKLGQLGIPIIECADYMETSPLGRAEWMKFYGLLYGREKESEKLFSDTEKEYMALRVMADSVSFRPEVLVDRMYGQAWNVPAAESTMGIFITDAGGRNPFSYVAGSGSVPMSGEQVLHKAGDADFWIVRYSQSADKNIRELSEDNAIYPQFKALKEGNVYGCNTSAVFFYEEVPFHPQWLLADLISIIHPEIPGVRPSHRYFSKMNP